MKYLVFCLKYEITLNRLIKLISNNYNIKSSLLKKSDFIESNNCFIFKNQSNINKIINLQKDFNNIDQILYFESKPEYLPYINIIKLNNKFKFENIYNFSKNYKFPKYFNDPNYDNHYIIEFNMIDYFKNIQEKSLLNVNINKLKNINNIISKFDILQFESINVKLHILCVYDDKDNIHVNKTIFNSFINNIKNQINYNKNDFYNITNNDSETFYNQCKICIITNEEINKFLDTNTGKQIIKDYNTQINNKKLSFANTIIEVNKDYINKFNINYLALYDIYSKYDRDDDDIIMKIDWDDINEAVNGDDIFDQRYDPYFVIEGNPDRIKFI